MENHGHASTVFKIDPATDFIKKEGGDQTRLSSIPLAPSSASITPKVEKHYNRKPLTPVPFSDGRSAKNKKKNKKRWYHNTRTVFVRRGPCDHVKAFYNKRDMVVELSVRRSRGATWLPESVEQEIFHQLNKGGFNIEPVENWGFLDFFNDCPEFSYVAGQPHKIIPVRMIQSNLKYEMKKEEKNIS